MKLSFRTSKKRGLFVREERWKEKSVNQRPHPRKKTAGKLSARSTNAKENGLLQTGTVRRGGHKQSRLKCCRPVTIRWQMHLFALVSFPAQAVAVHILTSGCKF